MSDSPLSSVASNGISRRLALRRLGGAAGAAVATAVSPMPTVAHGREAQADHNTRLIQQLFATLNGRSTDEFDGFVAPDVIFHPCGRPDPLTGRAGLKQLLAQSRQVDPVAPYELHSIVADGEQVAARWTRTVQRLDPDGGTPTVVKINGQFLCHLRNGQLVEIWSVVYPERA